MHRVLGQQARVVDLQQEAGVDDREVLLAHRLADRVQELLLRVVEGVLLPAFDVRRRDRRHEDLLGARARRRLPEVGDVGGDRVVPGVGDRAGRAHVHRERRAALHGGLVELGEVARLPRLAPRVAGAVGDRLEAAETVVDVGEEARLADLAVVDDVDPPVALQPDDLGHGLADAGAERLLVDRPALLLLQERREQVARPGQAADVRRQHPCRAPMHRAIVSLCGLDSAQSTRRPTAAAQRPEPRAGRRGRSSSRIRPATRSSCSSRRGRRRACSGPTDASSPRGDPS